MWRFLARLLNNEDGATAIEYALIGGMISIAIVGGATAIGVDVGAGYDDLAERFRNF